MSIDKVIDDTRTAMFSAKQAAQDKREWASYWDGIHYAYQSMLTPLEELKAELEALKDTSCKHERTKPAPFVTLNSELMLQCLDCGTHFPDGKPENEIPKTDEEKRIIFTQHGGEPPFGFPATQIEERDLPPAEPGHCRHRITTRKGEYIYCHSCGTKLMYE